MADTPLANEPTSPEISAGMTALRNLIVAAGPVLIAGHLATQTTVNQLLDMVGALATLAAASWSVYKSYRHARALKAAAPLVPNSIIASK